MADRSPQKETGANPEDDKNKMVEPDAQPEGSQDLPLEREKLLSQIEGEDEKEDVQEPKKKRRRRRRRRSNPDQTKEKPPKTDQNEEVDEKVETEEPNQAEELNDKQEEKEKPKKRRRRRRRSRKKKPQETTVKEEKQSETKEKAEEQESQPKPEPEKEVETEEPPKEEDTLQEMTKEKSSELASGFDEPLKETPPVEVEDHSAVEEVEESVEVLEGDVTEEKEQQEQVSGPEEVDISDQVEPEPEPELEVQPETEEREEPVIEQTWEGSMEEELTTEEEKVEARKDPKESEPESDQSEPELKPEPEVEPEPQETPEPFQEPQQQDFAEEDITLQPGSREEVIIPPDRAEPVESVEAKPVVQELPPIEEDVATIPADSKIELAPEDEESNLPPISMEKAKEEEKIFSQDYPKDQQEVVPEIVPSGDEELEIAPEGGTVETDTVEEQESVEETPEEVQRKIDEKKAELGLEEATLMEKQSLFDSFRNVLEELSPTLGRVFNVRIIGGIVAVILVVWGGFWIFSQNFFGLFEEGAPVPDEAARPFESSEADEYGVGTGQIFGTNSGRVEDQIPASVRIADYFGTLSEPRIGGETGITAATYYGELLDEREIVNQFVEYVRKLDELQNLYSIDVYSMLDQTTDRDGSLAAYLSQLEEAEVEGQRLLQAIQINVDDLTTSFNSVSDDKDTFENDFFLALNNLEAAKSDALLKSFVDVSQKQVALRARVVALSQVGEFYQTALEKLRERIDAVERNQQALVQGIRVVEVPGASELDLIIRP